MSRAAWARITFRHIMPDTIGPFIVLCTAQLASAILVEAMLSFLGLVDALRDTLDPRRRGA